MGPLALVECIETFSIETPMLRMSIVVLPAIISPIINSYFLSKVLVLLKNITLPPLFLIPEPFIPLRYHPG